MPGIRSTVLLVLLMPGLAMGHAGLVKSIPGSRAALAQAPADIELCFNEAVELKFSSISLHDAAKQSVSLGDLQLREDPKCIHARLPALSAGTYTVNYRVLSQDGHIVEYGYQFTIRPQSDLK